MNKTGTTLGCSMEKKKIQFKAAFCCRKGFIRISVISRTHRSLSLTRVTFICIRAIKRWESECASIPGLIRGFQEMSH